MENGFLGDLTKPNESTTLSAAEHPILSSNIWTRLWQSYPPCFLRKVINSLALLTKLLE